MHELLEFLQVFVCIKGNALAFSAVSSGAACFLVIPLQALWYIIVDDVSHIGLINSHSKCDSSYNYVDLFHQEIVLILRSRCRIHTCMISTGIDPVGLKYLSKLFYLLPAQAINDARLFRIVLDELYDVLIYILSFRTYLVIQIRTVERRLEDVCIHHSQVLLNIVLHLRRGRCSQRNKRCFSYFINNRTYPAIFRAEVVSPFGNTMCLVDSIE